MKIAFIGLGMMGRPMAERLLAHGFDVRVCDTNAALAEDFPEAWRATPREAAEDCELVVTMLPNGNIVSEVLTGSGGLLKGLKPGQIVVDCSSSDAAGTVALGKQLASEGVVLVDAPVSGGVPLAKEGKLIAVERGLQTLEPFVHDFGGDLVVHRRGGRAGARAVLEAESLRVTD